MNIPELHANNPEIQTRLLNSLLQKLPECDADALLKVVTWMSTEFRSDQVVTKEMILAWIKEVKEKKEEEKGKSKIKIIK